MSRVCSFPLEEEYKKPTGVTAADVARLRQWLRAQPHLPHEHITDLDLALMLHRHGCSAEVSKQQLDQQYTLRTLFASFFKDRGLDEKTENVLKSVAITILPTRSKEGHAIFYARMMDTDPNKFHFASSIKAVFMVMDLWQYEEGSWPGLVFLFDLQGIKMGMLTKLDLESIRQFMVYCPDALIPKLKAVHFINVPPFMDRINALSRTFMNQEFNAMVAVHAAGDLAPLASLLDVAGLPRELGGNYKSLDQIRDETLAKIKANLDFFAEENKKRVQESLRPGRPKTITDVFGSVEGSFKQLQID